jgi:hypothetical protein
MANTVDLEQESDFSTGFRPPEPEDFTGKPHIHNGWFCCLTSKKELAKRIQADECVVVRSHDEIHGNDLQWCITHNCEENYGHDLARRGR